MMAEEFIRLLEPYGIPAAVILGVRISHGPATGDHGISAVTAGRFAVAADDGQGDGHRVVIGWTAREDDPEADVPRVVPLTEWRREWLALGDVHAGDPLTARTQGDQARRPRRAKGGEAEGTKSAERRTGRRR